jgi:23S rRNA (uracil1939-C5)-methyltransferase
VGLHEAERYDRILDVERCLLQSDAMNTLLGEVRSFVRERGWPVYRQADEAGLLRFLVLREGGATGERMVNVVTASPDVPTARALADRLRERAPGVTAVVLNVNPKKAAVAVGVEEHPIAGNERIRERLGGLDFAISANSFFQTNTRQAERLFGIVAEYAALTGAETVFDLYSGTGAISLLLAGRARAVYGIELVPAAIEDATRNAAANGITNCTFLAGEVRDVLPDLLRRGIRAEVVVADPPRAGFHPKALRALLALAPARVVYVSCNPATLARDLGVLVAGGYRLETVQPIDMFPHTPHIEVVARLTRP